MGKTILLSGFYNGVDAIKLQHFIEEKTGEATIYALEVLRHDRVTPPYALVQFISEECASQIISLTSSDLVYGHNKLKVKPKDFDLVTPVEYAHTREGETIAFGWQISNEKFLQLWKREDITVKFGVGLTKVYFFFDDYKLELFCENIRRIKLHSPHDTTAKFLVIQVLGGPRIHKRCEVPTSSYYREEVPEKLWVRTTDFTTHNSIGDSSGICLKLLCGSPLPKFSEASFVYDHIEGPFSLEDGSQFSTNQELVPFVSPPADIELPYKTMFKLCMLVQRGNLARPICDMNLFRLVDPGQREEKRIEDALEKLFLLDDCCYEPLRWINEKYTQYCAPEELPKISEHLLPVRRVRITPCKLHFSGPELNMSNRVLRHYNDDLENFLRITFVDEELGKLNLWALKDSRKENTDIYGRILRILREGIIIGQKRFEFLAYSSSQLKDHSVWMFASSVDLTADNIRTWLGDFRQIRNVAKYAARLGQSFSSSREAWGVTTNDTEIIPDVEIETNGTHYVFSDGIGKISADFACSVASQCGLESFTPSAFQIRYSGYKGVVAVDPTSPKKLSLRKSMCKYVSENTELDILAWSKYQPCFLNRQLITLLSTLGVEDDIFLKKQNDSVQELDAIIEDPLKELKTLELMAPGETITIVKEILMCGYKPDLEPFLEMILHSFRAANLLNIRAKTRIFIADGRSMIGCLDESKTLDYGQVFVQISGPGSRECKVIKGKLFVAKSPCLHPGDVRVLEAVDVPDLHHLVDCLVFPQKGLRPHPNECSGSDLDGDVYSVCWDAELIPPRQMEPMDYTPAKSMELDHEITIKEVQEYFVNYIGNDNMGRISNAHVVYADKEPEKAASAPCVELAKLFSVAVDSAKSGVSVELPRHLRVFEFPDFMEKPYKPSYESLRVLGKLFRQSKDISAHSSSIKPFTREVAIKSYDRDMEVDGFTDYLDDALKTKTRYDCQLRKIMKQYGIQTEAEIISGNIMKMEKPYHRKKNADDVKFQVESLKSDMRMWLNNDKGGDGSKLSGIDDGIEKASACYHVTYNIEYYDHGETGQEHFISFPWCFHKQLLYIKSELTKENS